MIGPLSAQPIDYSSVSPVSPPIILSRLGGSVRFVWPFFYTQVMLMIFLPSCHVVWNVMWFSWRHWMSHRSGDTKHETTQSFFCKVSTRLRHTSLRSAAWSPVYLGTLISGSRFPLPHCTPYKCHQPPLHFAKEYIIMASVRKLFARTKHGHSSRTSCLGFSDNAPWLSRHEGVDCKRLINCGLLLMDGWWQRWRVSIAFKFKSNNLTPPCFLHPANNMQALCTNNRTRR